MSAWQVSPGQFYPGRTGLHDTDTRLKIIALLTACVMVFLYSGTEMLLFALLLFFFLAALRMPLLRMLRAIKSVWLIALITALLQFFLTPGKVIAKAGFLTVTDSGLYNGLLFSSRICALVLVLSCLTITSPPSRIADALSFFLRPLDRLGFSAGSFAAVLAIVLAFVPGTLARINLIMKAQAARGADFQTTNPFKRARELLTVMVPLFVKSFRDSEEVAAGMEARGFTSGARKTRLHPEKASGAGALALLVFAALSVAIELAVR